MSAPSLISPVIKVAGQDLSLEQRNRLESMSIQKGLRIPARAQFKFNDSGYELTGAGAFTVGTAVVVRTGNVAIFDGVITGVSLEQGPYRLQLTVTADDKSVKLTMSNRFEAYLSQTYSDVVSKVALRHGLTANVDATTAVHDYILQADTDFDFLNQMADRVGYDWWVEGTKLFFKKPIAGTPVTVVLTTETLHEFVVKASGLHPSSTTVSGWDPKRKQSFLSTATVSASTLKPDASLVTPFVTGTDLVSTAVVRSGVEGTTTAGEAADVAAGRSQQWASGAVSARGEGRINAAIVPGGAVTVEQAGPASGTYHVTQVEHVYSVKGFRTRWTAADRRPTGLVDSLGGPSASSFAHSGLVIGVVTQNENTNPGQVLGRKGDVKVKYVATDATVESHWARVATIGGGPNRGITFMPEIGDEVILGFEGGDTRRPIVLGAVYNGTDSATEYGVANGKVNSRRIMSRKGHTIEIVDDDSPAKDMLKLSLNGGEHLITLSKEVFEATIPAGKTFAIKAGAKGISLSADGTLTLEAQKIVLKATADVEISGMNVKVKATTNFEASGLQTSVKASAKGEVSAGGPMTVKGAIVQIN